MTEEASQLSLDEAILQAVREVAPTAEVYTITPAPFERGMQGSALAARRWSADELAAVDGAIYTVAHHRDLFTADDVWATLPEGFPVTKGLAGRLNAAVNRGIIANTGSTAFARRGGEHDHRQRLAVWRSLIRGGS